MKLKLSSLSVTVFAISLLALSFNAIADDNWRITEKYDPIRMIVVLAGENDFGPYPELAPDLGFKDVYYNGVNTYCGLMTEDEGWFFSKWVMFVAKSGQVRTKFDVQGYAHDEEADILVPDLVLILVANFCEGTPYAELARELYEDQQLAFDAAIKKRDKEAGK